MITINNKEYRNIVEQVQKNKEDIAEHYAIDRVLADFGIRIIGQLDDASLLPATPPTHSADYGAAYAVGTNAPYQIYIWTRADSQGGHDSDYWFNIGKIAIAGPQGAPGDTILKTDINYENKLVLTMSDGRELTSLKAFNTIQGEKGDTGPANSISAFIINPSTYQPTLIFKDGSTATAAVSIRGEKGEPGVGIQGKQGEPGRSLYIKGIVDSITNLPSAPTDLFGAYLVGATTPYLLYIPVEQTNSYVYAGQFMGGTIVKANDVVQDTWDADTKVDKTNTPSIVYATNSSGNQINQPLKSSAQAYSIPLRDVNGNITGPNQITASPADNQFTTKAYNDNTYLQKAPQYVMAGLYGYNIAGNRADKPIISYAKWTTPNINLNGGIPEYSWNGSSTVIYTGTPVNDLECANKAYVDANTQYRHHSVFSGIDSSDTISVEVYINEYFNYPASIMDIDQWATYHRKNVYYPCAGKAIVSGQTNMITAIKLTDNGLFTFLATPNMTEFSIEQSSITSYQDYFEQI